MILSIRPSYLLRQALITDAVLTGAMGILIVVARGVLADLLHLSGALLVGAAAILIPYAILVAFLWTRATLTKIAVGAVIAINVAWVLASIALLVSDLAAPSALGVIFILFQAAAVVAFAVAQGLGLRRSSAN